jgi:lipid-A-disaccharide synthase-like uncharacterized protein
VAGRLASGGGHRVNRRDTASKRWASRFANGLRSRLLKDATPDTGCGLKLIQRAAFLRLPYFDHMHRYIPALIQRHNGRMVVHPVNHRHRTAGVSKYGNIDRALVGILDLFGVWWLIKRTRLNTQPERSRDDLSRESLWLVVGFAGQLAFTGRFVLQWLYSEYKKRSVIPVSFWYLSIVSALLLMYAIYRQDPVFIAGQAFGFIVYLRNLQLIAKSKPQGIIMRRSLSPRVECLGLVARPAFGRCRLGCVKRRTSMKNVSSAWPWKCCTTVLADSPPRRGDLRRQTTDLHVDGGVLRLADRQTQPRPVHTRAFSAVTVTAMVYDLGDGCGTSASGALPRCCTWRPTRPTASCAPGRSTAF